MLGGVAFLGAIALGIGAVFAHGHETKNERKVNDIGAAQQRAIGDKNDPYLLSKVINIPLFNACNHTQLMVQEANSPCTYNRAKYLFAKEHFDKLGIEYSDLQLRVDTGYQWELDKACGTYAFLDKRK